MVIVINMAESSAILLDSPDERFSDSDILIESDTETEIDRF